MRLCTCYFYHFFVICYYFLFNQRLLEHCLEKTLLFQIEYCFFLTQNNKNITNFPICVTKLPYFVCYKVITKLSFLLIFKFNYFTLILFKANKKNGNNHCLRYLLLVIFLSFFVSDISDNIFPIFCPNKMQFFFTEIPVLCTDLYCV